MRMRTHERRWQAVVASRRHRARCLPTDGGRVLGHALPCGAETAPWAMGGRRRRRRRRAGVWVWGECREEGGKGCVCVLVFPEDEDEEEDDEMGGRECSTRRPRGQVLHAAGPTARGGAKAFTGGRRAPDSGPSFNLSVRARRATAGGVPLSMQCTRGGPGRWGWVDADDVWSDERVCAVGECNEGTMGVWLRQSTERERAEGDKQPPPPLAGCWKLRQRAATTRGECVNNTHTLLTNTLASHKCS